MGYLVFERNRTDVAEARVETSPVVEALNVIEQGGTGGGPGDAKGERRGEG